MNNKITLTFFFVFILAYSGTSQTIDELIQSNRENLMDLYGKRGAPPEWVYNGSVDERDIMRVLNDYNANVGLLIYTHHKDTLSTILLDKQGEVLKKHQIIEEDALINEIERANKWFSSKSFSIAPSKRGSIASGSGGSNNYKQAYENISKVLLPDNEVLKQFDHLIIVPTLNISIIPFAALKVSKEEYLIDFLSYSIAPSLYEIMVNHQMKGNRGLYDSEISYYFENALFIANPKFPSDSTWNFPSLPGTDKEVNYITNKIDSSNYIKLSGSDAKISRFINNICNYDLLYFATHGISAEENPLENSFLVLGEDSGKSFLTAREIQNIRYECSLKADLVILSACQTGLGQSHKAGLIGLTRAFQIAGANHVLMSLWNINDNETAVLMGLFFDNLVKGGELMPHEALRQAILTYKSEIDNNPNYWAAFAIFGIPY